MNKCVFTFGEICKENLILFDNKSAKRTSLEVVNLLTLK